MPAAYAYTSFREWESWLGYKICTLTDFTLGLPGNAESRFSFATAARSRLVPGACKSVWGGGAAFGEWLRPFGMKIWNSGSRPCTCWVPHLQSAPEPRSNTKTRLKVNGAPFKRGTQSRELPIMLVQHHCKWHLTVPASIRENILGFFLRVQHTGLLKILVESWENFTFLMSFFYALSS